MQWIYALELLALIGVAWRIGTHIKRVADVMDRGDKSDE